MANCNHKVPCGCGDNALTTPPPCNVSDICIGEPCSEILSDRCIAYAGGDLIVNVSGTNLNIKNGTRFSEIWQRLFAGINDATCVERVAVSLAITAITQTSITLTWIPGTAASYQINYDIPLSPNPLTSVALASTVKTFTLTGLLPDSDYEIFITAVGYTCDSVIIKVKTLL